MRNKGSPVAYGSIRVAARPKMRGLMRIASFELRRDHLQFPGLSTLPHVFDGEKDGEHGEHQNDGRNGLLFMGLMSKFQPE